MNQKIAPLKKGDLICILAPAKAIEKEHVIFATEIFEQHGFKVQVSSNCLGQYNYFSGTDEQRLNDFQEALDNPDIKAIVCARGGYGSIRILDRIQWASQIREPKWIVGFSDITVFHQRMQKLGMQSIHASMPLNFKSNTNESLTSLVSALRGEPIEIEIESHPKNSIGTVNGELVGGNLSILYSFLGTDDQIDYSGKILFIEEVGEQLYALDRMLYAFRKAGVFDKIVGLVVGGITNMCETAVPTNFVVEDLVLSHFEYRNIPVCFNFPAGHVDDNRALIVGRNYELEVGIGSVKLI